jgi:methyl-accepting chemotaxis protein
MKLSLRNKLILAMLVAGLLPAIAVLVIGWRQTLKMEEDVARELHTNARQTLDVIERFLFERYGDVQAFGLNHVVRDSKNWYTPGDENPIVQAMNDYVACYGIYSITLLVDLEGKVVAVNSKDRLGQPAKTDFLFDQNFANTGWFKDATAGKFTSSSTLTGTVVEDLSHDPLVKQVTGGDGATLGYAAPVKDASGHVIAIWKNFADWSAIRDAIHDAHARKEQEDAGDTEYVILASDGRVLEYHSKLLTEEQADDWVLSRNLAKEGYEPAKLAIRGESNFMTTTDNSRGQTWVAGWAKSQGALGYPGVGWSLIVQREEGKALGALQGVRTAMLVTLGIAAALVVTAAYLLGRSIASPIARIAQMLNAGADQTAAASGQVSGSSQQLAQGASEQAASISETVSSAGEMSRLTQQSADSARQAMSLAEEARNTAAAGNNAMKQMTRAIHEIEQASQQTSQILKTIDEIAFQTNLLALNAAVEAARAGEAGRGFAVVAEEVRNLAMRSAESAKNTSTLIEQSVTASRNGVQLSTDVAKYLSEINNVADKVSAIVTEIAQSLGQQAQGIGQINQAVSQMDKVTQQNAANAEESAAASEELSAQAEQLRSAVGDLTRIIDGAKDATPRVAA